MTEKSVAGRVSVVVASYNHARFLPARMESLLRQTYQDLEILVIDDCSTDNSLEVLSRYAEHPKVRLIAGERNGGWVAVSNRGLDLAQGEFVLFANCDDDCEPTMIEHLVAGMRAHPSAGLTFCRSLLVDEQGIVLTDDFVIRAPAFRERCATDTMVAGGEMTRFLLGSCVIPNLSAALFRREVFARVGGLSAAYRVCSDWDLFFRVFNQYDAAYVATPLNRFRQHRATIRSSTKDRVVYEEYFRLLLGRLRQLELSRIDRCRLRRGIMFLWAGHLIAPSAAGIKNFRYHLGRVLAYDAAALPLLIPAMALRGRQVFAKSVRLLFPRLSAKA